MIPKPAQQIVSHPQFDIQQTNLIARNREHWTRQVVELLPQQAATKPAGEATATLTLRLTPAQIAAVRRPHLLATWEGAWDVTFNGLTVKQVRYSLPHTPAGWHLPQPAVQSLRPGDNHIEASLLGPGKLTEPGAPLSTATPFIRLGLIDWR